MSIYKAEIIHFRKPNPENQIDFYPESLREVIDVISTIVYNGACQTGFSTTQDAYENAYDRLFNAMDKLEQLLLKQRRA